jgi:hypothetical protein
VLALARRGVLAVGVDISPAAVSRARGRGAAALLGSVFDPLPGTGRWQTALLLDGNVGIGGRPAELLTRLAGLLARSGAVICELDHPGAPTRSELVSLEDHAGERSHWFAWARVGVDGIAAVAAPAGLAVATRWEDEGRWFAVLAAGRDPR